MSEKTTDIVTAHKIELAIGELDSLSTLPEVAAKFFSHFIKPTLSQKDLGTIIESDPALSARVFHLVHQRGDFPDDDVTIEKALAQLGPNEVRDAVLSVKIFQSAEPDNLRDLPRKQLALHCLAVACAAKEIAQIAAPRLDAQLAYSAGLLHNIGLFAVEQAMPKSFTKIIKEAKSLRADICQVERKHLGVDHTVLGKRLAQKWHFPNAVTLAIWLHKSSTDLISQSIPEARIAQIVQLAYLLARQCNIGQSGCYNPPDSPARIAQSLEIASDQLQRIRKILPDLVAQKSEILGLDSPNVAIAYSDMAHIATARLAVDNTKLSLENRRLQSDATQFSFVADFLSSISAAASPIEAAENFALRWQKFYQTGPVCLFLAPLSESDCIQAALVESQFRKRLILTAPTGSPAIPKSLTGTFAIADAHENCPWLFEQLDVEFSQGQTKILPLISSGKALGALVFEFRYPVDPEQLVQRFRSPAAIAASVLDMTIAAWNQQNFAERFGSILTGSNHTDHADQTAADSQPAQPAESSGLLDALTEMAAGAAHELNNPLSVISGRAQLLKKSETDPEKKQILTQIQENARKLTQIIEDLMNFAQPEQPRKTPTDVRQILDEAVQLACQRKNLEQLDIAVKTDDRGNVVVDSAQVASAIANILCNSLESYVEGAGHIDVATNGDDSTLKLEITDAGCGMDTDTLQKALHPFFSARPAGRNRGMGLSHASRLIKLNNGSLDIQSHPGSGTTVTIRLPRK